MNINFNLPYFCRTTINRLLLNISQRWLNWKEFWWRRRWQKFPDWIRTMSTFPGSRLGRGQQSVRKQRMPERKQVRRPRQQDHPDPSNSETDTADYESFKSSNANICVYAYENICECVKKSLFTRTKIILVVDYWFWFYHFILDCSEIPSI